MRGRWSPVFDFLSSSYCSFSIRNNYSYKLRRDSLELILPANLDHPRIFRAGDRADIRLVQSIVRCREVRVIRHIEHLPPELYFCLLGDAEVPRERQTDHHQLRPGNNVSAGVPEEV